MTQHDGHGSTTGSAQRRRIGRTHTRQRRHEMNKLGSLIATSALLAGALCGAGCGSSATASRGAPRVVIVPDHPQRTIALRAVQLASINVPTLSWLSFYQGSVWVNAGDGFNTRIDARTNKPTGRIGKFTPGGAGNYCQGLGVGGGAVWSCLKTGVTRIDPTRMRIAATIPVGKAFDQGKLVFMDGRIWVITGPTGNRLVGIEPPPASPAARSHCRSAATIWPGAEPRSGFSARAPTTSSRSTSSTARSKARSRSHKRTEAPPPQPTCGSDQARGSSASTPQP